MAYWTAFILGLVGSLHCAGMCGPLALALPTPSRQPGGLILGRLAYNSGRILTYSALGVVFGLVGHALWLAGFQRWTSIGLGSVLLIGLLASRKLALATPIARLVGRLKSPMSALLRRPTLAALAVLGLLNGLLPCGLVYVACAGAVTVDGTLAGAGYMAMFGLGTLPMMLALSVSRQLLPGWVRLRLAGAVPVSVAVLGALLILRGLSLGIPYLSPDLSQASSPSCCHL